MPNSKIRQIEVGNTTYDVNTPNNIQVVKDFKHTPQGNNQPDLISTGSVTDNKKYVSLSTTGASSAADNSHTHSLSVGTETNPEYNATTNPSVPTERTKASVSLTVHALNENVVIDDNDASTTNDPYSHPEWRKIVYPVSFSDGVLDLASGWLEATVLTSNINIAATSANGIDVPTGLTSADIPTNQETGLPAVPAGGVAYVNSTTYVAPEFEYTDEVCKYESDPTNNN